MNRTALVFMAALAVLLLVVTVFMPREPTSTALVQKINAEQITAETVAGNYELGGEAFAAEIGTLTVPEIWSDPDSRTIELPLIRIHATGSDPAEPIFVLEGGPGSSNIEWGLPGDHMDLSGLLEHHDVVMVGYRGIDGSVSLAAPEVTEAYETIAENPFSGENLERLAQGYNAAFQRLQGEGVAIDSYTMIDVIDDLEAARTQLGIDQINLYSESYGTRVAYLYGLRYPDSLHRSALLAVNPPGHFVWEPEQIEAGLRRYAELWQQDADAVARSPDILATMRSVLASLPQEWQGFRIDPDKVKLFSFFFLFNRSDAARVFDAYVAAENGDYAGLAFMSVGYDFFIPTLTNWGDRASKALSADFDPDRDYLADMNPPGSILGSPASIELGVLGRGWPITPIPDEYQVLRESEVETLLVNGNVDFSTPVESAEEMLSFLPNGELVVLSEMGHTTDLATLQPEAMLHLLETFYLTGEVDDSRFVYDPMDFTLDRTFGQMAREFVAQQAGPSEIPLEARLQATLDDWRESNGIIGVTLAVASPELGVIELASGIADLDAGTAMTPADPLMLASMSKTYVATVVLQLVDEGLLTLDDSLSRWFPEFPNANGITIRQLLSHTSGAPDYMSPENRVSFANTALERSASDWPGWTPDELLEVAAGMEPAFEPGTSFTYSNSNTVLLGRIIELLTGNPLHVEMRGRLFEPLALEHTFYAGAEAIPGSWGPGYSTAHAQVFGVSEPPMLVEERLATLIMTSAGASGSLVATAGDVVRFEQALFGAELLEEATLAEMVTPSPVVANFVTSLGAPDIGGGLGVFMYPFPEPLGVGIGHDGGEPGFVSFMLTFPEHDISVAMLMNDDRPDFNIFPRGEDVDALLGEVVRVTLEGVTGTEISLEGAPTEENVYWDPEGRFSLPLIGDWTELETDGSYASFALAEPPVDLSLVTVATGELEAGVDAALVQVGLDPATLTLTSAGTSLGLWSVYFYAAADEQGAAVLAQVKDDTTYVIIGTGREEVVARGEPPGDVLDTIEGFNFAGTAAALPSTVEAFEGYLNSFVGTAPPGLSIAIAAGGDVIYANGFGLADGPLGLVATADTVYQWGSMAKMVTATAVMQLVDRGLIELDASVSEYLDYFPREFPITVRQLLTHSAGLPEADVGYKYFNLAGEPLPDPDVAAREYALGFTGPIFEPGTTSAYANPHLLFLGQIVAEASGQPYIDYAREHILTPLGMNNTDFTYSSEAMIANAASHAVPAAQRDNIVAAVNQFWEFGDAADVFRESDGVYAWQNRYDLLAAWGGLKGPPTEALRFVQMHLNGGELDGVRILSPEAAASMREVQLSTGGEPLEFTLGWRVSEDAEHPYVEHAGGGTGIRDLMRIYPADGVAIVMMSNGVGYDDVAVVDAAANVVFSQLAP